jgi:hypothetical protein
VTFFSHPRSLIVARLDPRVTRLHQTGRSLPRSLGRDVPPEVGTIEFDSI